MRLDQYLSTHDITATRARAQDAIKQGRVFVNGKLITKNAFDVNEDDVIECRSEEVTLASRAGFKLYDVLDDFDIQLADRICLDVGASTGGFSDVCLKEGASIVYAVDVGRDQLAAYLKEDARVVNMEGVNCRYLQASMFSPAPDFACMDVSFISVKMILPALADISSIHEMVILIKPQFEAGRQHVNKHGIVKDEKVHIQVLRDMIDFVESLSLNVHHLQASSLLGRDGNKEFVMHIRREPCSRVFPLKTIVKEYHVKR